MTQPFNLLKGDIALITGAASSIGRAIALTVAREGAVVILTDINQAGNEAVAAEIVAAGGSATAITSNLALRSGWRELLGMIGEQTPTVFVHSACPPRVEADTPLVVSEETFEEMITTNIQSGFFLGREIAARIKEKDLPGRMLYITSLHAYTPRNLAHYSAGKAGMTMVMRELARDLGPAGIRVNAIAPGAVPGGGASISEEKYAAMIPMRRTGRPQDVADMAIALLSDRFSGYVTGTTVLVDGGMSLFNWVPFAEP